MKTLEKAKFVGQAFMDGAKHQLKQPITIGAATYIGIGQGLKYNGSIKRGVETGVVIVGVMVAAAGVYNVIYNWDRISEL